MIEFDVHALQLLRESRQETGLWPCAPTCDDTCGQSSCEHSYMS